MPTHRHDADLAQLRATARRVLLTHGTAIAPHAQTPEYVDDLIGDLVRQRSPELDAENQTLFDEVPDRDLARRLSDQGGAIMAAYGDAGYFIGLAMGLELASLTYAQPAPRAPKRAMRRRGGAR